MGDDHLFVCFSEEAQAAPIGEPPHHENIKDFAANLDESSFEHFINGRYAWHWYPIITSGFSSFPVHGDLPEHLNQDQLLRATGYTATICSREDGRRFISALGLLALLCRAVDSPQGVPALTQNFMFIRESATRNSIDPNILFWFSNAALYQLNTSVVPDGYDGSFDRAGLNAPDKGWRGYGMSLDFPPVDPHCWRNCPGGENSVRKEIEGIKGGEFVLEFQRSALHQDRKYWIWLYKNISDKPVWHWYVYIVQTAEGATTVHRHSMHSVVNMTPEELVAKHAFGQEG
jgi:hypothetical protein